MSTRGCEGSWQSAVFAFPAGSLSDPAERDPAAAGAQAPVGSAAGLPRVQPGAGRGAALVCPGAAAGECGAAAGETAARGRGFLVGPPSDNLQSRCFSHAKPAESSPGLAWQGPFEVIWTRCPARSRDIFKQIRWLRALPDLSLDVSREEAPPTSLGTLCQCVPTLPLKKFFLRSNLSLLPSLEFQTIPLCPVATEPVRNLTLESNGFISFFFILWAAPIFIISQASLQPDPSDHRSKAIEGAAEDMKHLGTAFRYSS